MKKLLSALVLATLFTGCASTQGTTNPFIQNGDVILEETSSSAAAPAYNFVQTGDVIL